MKMNNHPDAAGWGGKGSNHGCRGSHGGCGAKKKSKKKGHVSNTEAIKYDIFECGKGEHAVLFKKSKRNIIDYTCHEGENETILIVQALKILAMPTTIRPPPPPQIEDTNNPGVMAKDHGGIIMRVHELQLIPKLEHDLQNGVVQAYALLINQSFLIMQSKLEQLPNYPIFNAMKDPFQLLTKMRNIICGREYQKQDLWSMCQMIKLLCLEFQKPDKTNETYVQCLDGMWEALPQQGGSLWAHEGLTKARALCIANKDGHATANISDIKQAVDKIEVGLKAAFMLSGANNHHKALKDCLENSYTMGRDDYPNNTTKLLSMLNNFHSNDGKLKCPIVPWDEDYVISFLLEGAGGKDEGIQMLMKGGNKQGNKKGTKQGSNNIPTKREEILQPPPYDNAAERGLNSHKSDDKVLSCIHCGGNTN